MPYIDSYGNYYANWSPELYQKYGLPQEYYQPALHDSKKSVRRQGPYDMMTNMFGEEAGVLKMIIDLKNFILMINLMVYLFEMIVEINMFFR